MYFYWAAKAFFHRNITFLYFICDHKIGEKLEIIQEHMEWGRGGQCQTIIQLTNFLIQDLIYHIQ